MPAPRTTIARLRWNRGWTQPQLSVKSGVSVQAIQAMEAGRSRGTPATVKKLAEAFNADVDDIIEALLTDYVGPVGADGEREIELDDRAAEA